MYIREAEKKAIENTGFSIPDIKQLAEISDLHEAVIDGVIDAARTAARIEQNLRTVIANARRALDAAEAALNAGTPINERGILQATATEIDILAARRLDAYVRLTMACRTAALLPVPSPAN
jgi:hypothetical protein